MPAVASTEAVSSKKEKKHKKSSKSQKKRSLEDDGAPDSDEPKHKKSRSTSGDSDEIHNNGDVEDKKEKKKKKKEKHHDRSDADRSEKKKHKKKYADGEEKTERKKKKSKKTNDDEPIENHVEPAVAQSHPEAQESVDAMEIDEPAVNTVSDIYQPPDIPAKPQFPFFSQTVSLYEPIYPIGWAQPVTNCEYHYLRHLQNKYVPSLRGVLMNYKNVTLGDEPSRVGAATDDEGATTLKSQREYGVGFGWITADVDLFVPSRGAWMEGSVNLQTEGHVGVVCFGKFNASIEARRLPPSWKWVSNEDPMAEGMEETASVAAPDEHGVVHQIHSTGFWVDANSDKVKGKIRFRIRNYDVGISGETTYLSLEGTMLDKASEKTLVQQEARTVQMRRNTWAAGRRPERRRAPEFSMTRFMSEEEKQAQEEREAARAARAAAAAVETAERTKVVFED